MEIADFKEERKYLLESESHKDLDRKLLQYAHVMGYLGAHFRPGMTGRTYYDKDGNMKNVWVTAVQGDAKDFPDWLFFKGSDKIAVEVKTEKDKARPGQLLWLKILSEAGFKIIVGKPSNWDEVEKLFT